MTTSTDLINSSSYNFYFLVVDKFLDISLPQLTNFISITPQLIGLNLTFKNSGQLLSHPKTISFIKQHSAKSGRKIAIVPFKPSAKIEFICRQQNWLMVANPSATNRLLEDKIKFYQLCQQHNLPLIPSLILPFTKENYSLAASKFSSPLVLQTHFGWAGNSSHLSQKYQDVQSKISPGVVVKFSPFLPGYSLINNCCLTDSGLVQSPPGLQFTGLRQLSTNPLATVGRQWPSFTPKHIDLQIKTITELFTQVLQLHDYKGFFGLDFLVHQQQVYLLECNPRLTASFALYTKIEIDQIPKLTPLFLLHLAQFIGLKLPAEPRFNQPLSGAELTKKNSTGTTISKQIFPSSISKTYDPINIELHHLSQSQ